jgi:hypothetical protein
MGTGCISLGGQLPSTFFAAREAACGPSRHAAMQQNRKRLGAERTRVDVTKAAGIAPAAHGIRGLRWRLASARAGFDAVHGRLLRLRLLGSVVGDLAAYDFTIERERLKDDVEALAVLVLEHEPEIEPKVVLAFAPDYGVGAVRRLSRFIFLRHGTLLVSGCDVLRGQVPGTHSPAPARADRSLEMAETTDTLRAPGCPSRSRVNQSGIAAVAIAPTMDEWIDRA